MRVFPAAKKRAFRLILFLSFTVADTFQPVSIWGIKSSDESKSRAPCSPETMLISEHTPHLGPKLRVVQPSCKPCPSADAPEISFLRQQSVAASRPSWAKVLNVLQSQRPMGWRHNPHDSRSLLGFSWRAFSKVIREDI